MHQAQNSFPIGVERVLYAAATDDAFRKRLLDDRHAALEASPFTLSNTERALLSSIPNDQLAAAIAALDVRPANVRRRAVLSVVATSAAGLATLQLASGCLTGTRPEDDPSRRKDGGTDGGPGDGGTRDRRTRDSGPPPRRNDGGAHTGDATGGQALPKP